VLSDEAESHYLAYRGDNVCTLSCTWTMLRVIFVRYVLLNFLRVFQVPIKMSFVGVIPIYLGI